MSSNSSSIPHKPVLVSEVIQALQIRPHGIYLDATFGSGGHTKAILDAEPTCRVIAIDWDIRAIEQFGIPLQDEYGERLKLIWSNFSLLYKFCKKEQIINIDGVLADFGTSQVQIRETPGLSVYVDAPLDMRMAPSYEQVTAADVLATASEEKLRQIFWQLGEEKYAKQVAKAIIAMRPQKPLETTLQLAELVARCIPAHTKKHIHPATKVFQALRIYVNKELAHIEAFLAAAIRVLKPGGSIVCISFHSLEDRIVKQFFQQQTLLGTIAHSVDRPMIASPDELSMNPSARSAKLRFAKIQQG